MSLKYTARTNNFIRSGEDECSKSVNKRVGVYESGVSYRSPFADLVKEILKIKSSTQPIAMILANRLAPLNQTYPVDSNYLDLSQGQNAQEARWEYTRALAKKELGKEELHVFIISSDKLRLLGNKA